MIEGTPIERYHTFWPRLWAGLIDGLVFIPLSWVNTWVWANLSAPPILVVWFVVDSLSLVTYSVVLHGLFGQTLGKRAMGIRVLDVSEARLSIKQALRRDSVYVGLIAFSVAIDLPMVITGLNPYDPETFLLSDLSIAAMISLYASFAWFVIEILSMLSNPKRRAVHDLIAGSVVVRLSHPPSA